MGAARATEGAEQVLPPWHSSLPEEVRLQKMCRVSGVMLGDKGSGKDPERLAEAAMIVLDVGSSHRSITIRFDQVRLVQHIWRSILARQGVTVRTICTPRWSKSDE